MPCSPSAADKSITLSTLVSLPKSNWKTFLDKLNISNNEDQKNMLPIQLFQILVQELISNEKDYKPFWTHVYTELSEKLSSPIVIGYPDSLSTLSNASSKKQEEFSPFLTMNTINLQSKNSPKTFCLSSTSTAVAKWEKEAIATEIKQPKSVPLKTLKIKMKPSKQQRKIIDEWIHTSRFVYNKTVDAINKGDKPNHFNLRDKLVTEKTKKNNKDKEYISCIEELAIKNSFLKPTAKQHHRIKSNIIII